MSDPNLSNLEIREILLSELCNDDISINFVLLRNDYEYSKLYESENILELKIAPNWQGTGDNWIDYDILINWSDEEENYHYQHEISYKYIIDLGNKSGKLENIYKLTERNEQSDLMQTIVEDINSYYKIIKSNEIPYFFGRGHV